MATTLASLRFRIGPLALIVLFAIGVELRYAQFETGFSDVPLTIRTAINQALHGQDPYTEWAAINRPPFPYGPLTLVWYLPWRDPRIVEFGVSMLLLALIAFRGRPMGLALWATLPIVNQLASDGSNDGSAALLLLVALVVLERMPRTGALSVGVAAGFKVYALAWLPPIFIWAGAGAFAVGVAAAVAVWLPAMIMWGPLNILSAFRAADAVHQFPYYSLGEALLRARHGLSRSLLDTFRLVAGAVTGIAVSPFARTHGGVVAAGAAIYLVTLYSGWWSTPAYLLPLLLLLCWYVDVWLGPPGSRIAWPSDPVGLVSDAVDKRLPKVDARRGLKTRLESAAHDD